MREIESLLIPRWIIPVEPAGVCLSGHALAIDGGRIIDLLPAVEADRRYTPRQRRELPTHALIPGLINAHTHAAMALLRGLADDLPLMQWLNDHIWPAEAKWVGPEFVQDGTQLAILEMLKGGTTCFNDMYFFPDVTARAASAAGIRACVGLITIDFPSAWASDSSEYLAKGIAVHDQFHNDPLITTAFAPHAPYTVSDEPLAQIRVMRDELEIPLHMHVHETAFEVAQAVEQTGRRPLERLRDLGLVGPALNAVHMTQLEEQEIELLADANASVVHCPESNLKLASGFCPVARLVGAGVNVALGTDGAASNNDLDLFSEMRTAALLAKGVAGDAAALPAAEALQMATLNGARALGLGELTGSLVPGKQADLVAVDLAGVGTQPVYNPISHLVYAASRDCVTDVWVSGRQLLKSGRFTRLDADQIIARAQAWADRIATPAAQG